MDECVVLLSRGRHPVSGRARLVPAEAAAIAMAQRAGLAPRLLHAGQGGVEGPLSRGLGLGAARLDLIEIGEADDPLPALADALAGADLILAAARAEAGECSGMVPFLLGAALGRTVLSGCIGLGRRDGRLVATRKVDLSRREVVAVPEGAVVVVDASAPRAALGRLVEPSAHRLAGRAEPDPRQAEPARAARKRPPPIGGPRETGGEGRRVSGAEEGAKAILDLLRKADLTR